MPELPEVETIRRDLAREILHRRITGAIVDGTRTVRRHDPETLVNGLAGRRVEDVRRKGKFLLVDLDGPTLVVHLRMSGQLLWTVDPESPLARHTHARIALEGGEELRFVDPRTFGELWLTERSTPELGHLGPDAFSELDSPGHLATLLLKRRSGMKTLLMNQQVVAGIGNIYSDEILFAAGVRHDRLPQSLSEREVAALFDATGTILAEAVERRGSSLADQQYVDLYGSIGTAQRAHSVYAREGQPCVRCGAPIERVKVGGRSSYLCPRCQS